MTNNLKLITTETFGDLSCNFYRNMNDDILLTREQIGLALEYSDPMVAIGKIHKRHKDRLDNFSFTILVNGHETFYYSEKGIMEICRWSKSDKANQFMDWVWDIVEKYRNNEFVYISQQNNIENEKIIELLTSMDNRLSKLEEQTSKKKLPEKKYSRWKTNIFRKLNTLLSYVNENSDDEFSLPNIIHLVIGETEDIYHIEINEYVDLYRCEFYIGTDVKVQVLDVINHYKDIRNIFTLTLDSILEKLHIAEDIDCNENYKARNIDKILVKARNIFDELAAKVDKE